MRSHLSPGYTLSAADCARWPWPLPVNFTCPVGTCASSAIRLDIVVSWIEDSQRVAQHGHRFVPSELRPGCRRSLGYGVRLRGGQRGQQLAEARRNDLDASRPHRGRIAYCEHRLPAERWAEHLLPPSAEGGVRGVGAEEQGDAALGHQQPFVQHPDALGVVLGCLSDVSEGQRKPTARSQITGQRVQPMLAQLDDQLRSVDD